MEHLEVDTLLLQLHQITLTLKEAHLDLRHPHHKEDGACLRRHNLSNEDILETADHLHEAQVDLLGQTWPKIGLIKSQSARAEPHNPKLPDLTPQDRKWTLVPHHHLIKVAEGEIHL